MRTAYAGQITSTGGLPVLGRLLDGILVENLDLWVAGAYAVRAERFAQVAVHQRGFVADELASERRPRDVAFAAIPVS